MKTAEELKEKLDHIYDYLEYGRIDVAVQMLQAIQLEALKAGMTLAAEMAGAHATEVWAKYKRGHGPERADPHYQGISCGAEEVERLIAEHRDSLTQLPKP